MKAHLFDVTKKNCWDKALRLVGRHHAKFEFKRAKVMNFEILDEPRRLANRG